VGGPIAETLDIEHDGFPCSFHLCINIKLSVHPRIGIEFVSLETIRKRMKSEKKKFRKLTVKRGARDSVVGSGSMLKAVRSPIRVPDEMDIFNLSNNSRRTMALGSSQPLTEMSARNLPGGNKRQAHRADNFAAICEPNV
jgi:hypothetical protein